MSGYQTPPPATPATESEAFTSRDAEHLQLLSVFHYVLAGIVAFFGCFPFVYVIFGAIFAIAPAAVEGPGQDALAAAVFGLLFMAGGCVAIVIAWLFAGLEVYAGRCLASQRNHTFCLVIAALNCAWIPMGTVLGVFTIIVLMRPGVKARFDALRPRP